MDEQEWMRRVDRHLDNIERGNETARDYMREGHELMARLDDTMERNRVAFEDLRDYLQQATTILGALMSEIRDGRREQNESWQAWRAESRAWRKETREWQRMLHGKIDRLQPPPSAA
jgi:hypothetical protein